MTTVTEVDVSAPEVEVRVGARTGAVLAVASLAGLVLSVSYTHLTLPTNREV